MLQNRTWIDPQAEAEFWQQMERLEAANARLSSVGGIRGLLGGPFRRAALQRDIDAIRSLAQDLVNRHTVVIEAAVVDDGGALPMPASDPLRTLAGMVVSLRQDRFSKLEAEEGKTV